MNDVISRITEKISSKLEGWFEGAAAMLPNFVIAVLVVLAMGLVARWVSKWVSKALNSWTDNKPVSDLMGTITRIVIVALGLFFALSLLQLEKTVTSLLAGVGVVGLALGFAFQDIAANFMSGLFLAFRGNFEVGDVIEVAGHRGTVQHIELRATTIRTFQGLTVIIPNKEVFQNDLVNYTLTEERRIDIPVGVAYSDDLQTALDAIVEEVSKIETRDPDRDVKAFFTGFGGSSIDLVVHVWMQESSQPTYLAGRSEAIIAIKRAVDNAGLTIPFPIRTLDFGASVVGGEGIATKTLHVVDREVDEAAAQPAQ